MTRPFSTLNKPGRVPGFYLRVSARPGGPPELDQVAGSSSTRWPAAARPGGHKPTRPASTRACPLVSGPWAVSSAPGIGPPGPWAVVRDPCLVDRVLQLVTRARPHVSWVFPIRPAAGGRRPGGRVCVCVDLVAGVCGLDHVHLAPAPGARSATRGPWPACLVATDPERAAWFAVRVPGDPAGVPGANN